MNPVAHSPFASARRIVVGGGFLLFAIAILWLLAPPASLSAAGESYALISRGYDGTPANGDSHVCGVSADGRYIAFHSDATNIVASPPAPGIPFEVTYLHDRTAGTTVPVSLNTDGSLANTMGTCALSADGNTVVFSSSSDDLPGDGNGNYVDIFAYDRTSNQTEIVSIGTLGEFGDESSTEPKVSGDGRYVVFTSSATTLVPNFTSGQHVILRDRQTDTTSGVSVATDGSPADRAFSYHPDISRDGRYVVFASLAENLTASDTNFATDIFLRDVTAATTSRVSINRYGVQGNSHSTFPLISADGSHIAFYTRADNLIAPSDQLADSNVIIRDRALTELYSVAWRASFYQGYGMNLPLGMSADGQRVLFRSDDGRYDGRDTNDAFDIYLSSRTTSPTVNATDYVTVLPDDTPFQGDSGGNTDFPLNRAYFSDDQQLIAFDSTATNIDAADPNPNSDVYLRLGSVMPSPSAVTVSTWQVSTPSQSVGALLLVAGSIVAIALVAHQRRAHP